ncbi:MAG TPA: Fur family transcriptional regulator [Acholeplasmataceae bacterium]|jgi:Mn-dependent DtxR family transcriptional regulator|nr:Fur family transcriptional regulator [Acholeplasmataceae bacterium]
MKNNFHTFSKYIKANILTISEEDYLEMIYRLCLIDNYTRVSDIAKALNVKPPSVSIMIKKLFNKNLIKHIDYGVIQLTEAGRKHGKELFERHESVEQFLKLLNIKGNILEETEKIEHTLSSDTISKIKLLVAFFAEKEEILTAFNHYLKEKE